VRGEDQGATVFFCNREAGALQPNQTWVFTFNATGSTPGDYTALVTLTKPDDNLANDRDNAVITVLPPLLRDVAVNITATPDVGPGSSNITYTINM
jgi:hypothetical protein